MKKIILASGSPRKISQLTQLIGNNFEAIESNYEEDNTLDIKPLDMALFHSKNKGLDVASRVDSGIIISCDMFITYNGKVLGKPHTPEVAKKSLQAISGKNVESISGITIIDQDNNKIIQDYVISKVKIKELDDKEIDDYISTGEPLDKACGFGIQERGVFIVEYIEGDYNSIVGMPLFKLNQMLNKVGVYMFDYK